MKIFKMTSVIRSFKLQFLLLLLFTVHCSLFTFAQSSFTQRLQQSKSGEGKITVTQDKAIDELVNGPVTTAATQAATTGTTTPVHPKNTQKQTEKKENNTATNTNQNKDTKPKVQPVVAERTDTVSLDAPEEIQKKIMKGTKVAGYRVQVFAGGNSRNDRIKAERIGSEIKGLFPGEPVYVHFYSPRWICRMGNYRTYEEAHAVLQRVKNNGYQSAIIVKGKITVQYQ